MPLIEVQKDISFGQACQNVIGDCIDEISAAYDFFALLNCRNLNQKKVIAKPPAALNDYIQSRGLDKRKQARMLEYSFLDLDSLLRRNLSPEQRSIWNGWSDPGSLQQGRFVSPHVRRQHLRFLPELKKVVCVKEAKVNFHKKTGNDAIHEKTAVLRKAIGNEAIDSALSSMDGVSFS